ncbi:MAG: LytR family transcriptional regulator [Ruminococcaceae bacterium]|nr:LytR family transcriptional regulator [Oscillospiraceae bacterium]
MKFYGGKKKNGSHTHAASGYQIPHEEPRNQGYTLPEDDFDETFEAVNRAVAAKTAAAAGQKAAEKELKEKKSRRGLKIALIVLAVLLALMLALIVWAIRYVKPPEPVNDPVHGTTTAASTTTAATTTTAAATDSTTASTSVTTEDPNREKTEDELLEELAAMATDIDVSNEKQREGVFTILVVGTDIDGIRTDTIVMATLDTQAKTVAMLNVPRDTMSKSASGKIHKINAAFNGGIERTKKEVTNLLGYEANRYVIVDYDAFENLINAIGGVEIDVPRRMYYRDPDQDLTIDLQPGLQVLDGENALDYMRFRKGYANQDLGRIEAQQGVYKALIEQLATPKTLLKIPALAEVFFENVETDLSIGEIIWLGTQFYDMDTANITTDTIPNYSRMYNSQSYVVASTYKMLSMINESFNPYESDIKNVSVITPPASSTKKTTASSDDPDTGDSGDTGSSGSDQPPAWLGGGSGESTTAATTAATVPPVYIPADTTAAPTPDTNDNSQPPAWLG